MTRQIIDDFELLSSIVGNTNCLSCGYPLVPFSGLRCAAFYDNFWLMRLCCTLNGIILNFEELDVIITSVGKCLCVCVWTLYINYYNSYRANIFRGFSISWDRVYVTVCVRYINHCNHCHVNIVTGFSTLRVMFI